MLVGLERVSAVAGSLLPNLEGPFTMALAVLLFREHLGRYGIAAVAFILTGAGLLKLQSGDRAVDGCIAAVALACLAWAIDNNLAQRLSVRDPFAIVRIKAWVRAASTSLSASFWAGGCRAIA